MREVIIEKNIITSTRFAQCSNSKCSTVFLTSALHAEKEPELLCPHCQVAMQLQHMVQCQNCESIIDFIPTEYNEEPIVFYAKKCSKCSGTAEDERRIKPLDLTDQYIFS